MCIQSKKNTEYREFTSLKYPYGQTYLTFRSSLHVIIFSPDSPSPANLFKVACLLTSLSPPTSVATSFKAFLRVMVSLYLLIVYLFLNNRSSMRAMNLNFFFFKLQSVAQCLAYMDYSSILENVMNESHRCEVGLLVT